MNKHQRKAAILAKRHGQEAHRARKRRAKALARLRNPSRFTFLLGEMVTVDRLQGKVGIVVRLNPTVVRLPDGTEHVLAHLIADNI